mgnify:CR=1 FL=1
MVSLASSGELQALEVPQLGSETQARHMAWYHVPMPAGAFTGWRFEQAWAKAGPIIRFIVRQGFDVLIHSRGGDRRANHFAARLLVELGVPLDQAIRRVRLAQPGALLGEDALTALSAIRYCPEPWPDMSASAMEDRAKGALLGLAAGDALASAQENGQWSSSTAMTLALADSLLQRGQFDAADAMQRLRNWQETGAFSPSGVSGRRGTMTDDALSGVSAPDHTTDASLVRIAPLAIRYHNDRLTLRDAAIQQCLMTHAAPEAVDACLIFSEMLADAIQGTPPSQVLARSAGQGQGAFAAHIAERWRGRPRYELNPNGQASHSLTAALWCVGRTGDFKQAVTLAAGLTPGQGRLAAITGQLAGALYGQDAIPRPWLRSLPWRKKISPVADALLP